MAYINQEQIDFIIRESERSEGHRKLLKTVEALNASRKDYSAEVVTAHFRNNDDSGTEKPKSKQR